MIEKLIEDVDTVEIVRDNIGTILAQETANQQELAKAAGKDPKNWEFRVFVERSNPWAFFLDATEPESPVINVTLESVDYGMSQSTIVGAFSKATALFNIDCYGYGIGSDDPSEPGHRASDKMSCIEAVRAARFARQVLSSAQYIYLASRGADKCRWVHRRWLEGMTIFQPATDDKAIQQVVAARLALRVEFNEAAPQHEGMPLEGVTAGVKRRRTGEVYFVGEYGSES